MRKQKKQSKTKIEKNNKKGTKKKVLEGVIVGNKMQKTVVVKIITKKPHPLYKKIVTKTKRYKAHTDKDLNIGDAVKIEQCKPISKEKKWRVIEVTTNNKS